MSDVMKTNDLLVANHVAGVALSAIDKVSDPVLIDKLRDAALDLSRFVEYNVSRGLRESEEDTE